MLSVGVTFTVAVLSWAAELALKVTVTVFPSTDILLMISSLSVPLLTPHSMLEVTVKVIVEFAALKAFKGVVPETERLASATLRV